MEPSRDRGKMMKSDNPAPDSKSLKEQFNNYDTKGLVIRSI